MTSARDDGSVSRGAYFVAALILSGRSEGATLPGREETFPG